MSGFTERRDWLMKARDERMGLFVTAGFKDCAVEVTVGSQRESAGMRFVSIKRRMVSGRQFAAGVVGVLADARQGIAERVAARFEAVSDSGLGFAGSGWKGLGLVRFLELLGAEGLLTEPVPECGGGRRACDSLFVAEPCRIGLGGGSSGVVGWLIGAAVGVFAHATGDDPLDASGGGHRIGRGFERNDVVPCVRLRDAVGGVRGGVDQRGAVQGRIGQDFSVDSVRCAGSDQPECGGRR
ncbi:hypothetical protein [Streptomyces sp. NPDC048473]|uniref:hypothetical protein n=1 Tax=unclassified Streptomyces TaxID=2593676 RepID=UPI00371F6368